MPIFCISGSQCGFYMGVGCFFLSCCGLVWPLYGCVVIFQVIVGQCGLYMGRCLFFLCCFGPVWRFFWVRFGKLLPFAINCVVTVGWCGVDEMLWISVARSDIFLLLFFSISVLVTVGLCHFFQGQCGLV